MAIEIDNDYALYQITDTLHELVDRLNLNQGKIDLNTREVDSALSALMSEYQPSRIQADSDFSINTSELIINADSDIQIYSASDVLIRAPLEFAVDAGSIKLDASGGISFLDNGTEYASLDHDSGNLHLQISVSSQDALTLSGTEAIFPGTILMPSSGTGSPSTVSKTVSGSITEVHDELDALSADLSPRINTLEGAIPPIQSDVQALQSRVSSTEGRISNLEALNISSRLNSLEANLQNILLRLDILEI